MTFREGWIAGVATYQAEPYPRPMETRVEHDGARRPQSLSGDRGRASRAAPLPPSYTITGDTTEMPRTSALPRSADIAERVRQVRKAPANSGHRTPGQELREVVLRATSPSCPTGLCLMRSAFLNCGRGLTYHVDNDIRLGEHRHVAARHLGDGRSHAL